jgi:hypothetical protein
MQLYYFVPFVSGLLFGFVYLKMERLVYQTLSSYRSRRNRSRPLVQMTTIMNVGMVYGFVIGCIIVFGENFVQIYS